MTVKFNLYSSEGCHLCEQALALCQPLITNQQLAVIDIVEDESLVAQYGVHIPVLEHLCTGNKLYWPFTQEDIKELITTWN